MHTTHAHPPLRRLSRLSWLAKPRLLPAILALGALAASAESRAESIAFSDPLTGPSTPNLSVPSDYSYTAQGLQRTGNSVYRSLVKTVSGAHLTAAKFTAEVAVNVAPGDIAFVGLGQGVSNPSYGPNEPTNSFVFRIHNLGGYQSIDAAVAAGFSGSQFLQIGSIGSYAAGSTTVFRITRDGDSVTLSVPSQNASRTYSLAQYQAQMGLTNSNTRFFFGGGGNNNSSLNGTRFVNASVTLPAPVVYGSGLSPVIAWDPIFPATAFPNAAALSTPTQTVGPLPTDPRWANPHAAFVFPKGTHSWENIPPMNFDANWINAWSNISSQGPAGQNWTKYSTTVTGQGDFVLQFLADNVSWIYLDGALVGYQDWNWQSVGTGRYTISLTGSGPHELVFIIWDGGGSAGGKFRLETTQSFIDNGGGSLPPPPPPADTAAPVISAPSPVVKEATSADGAIVTFTATATDAVSGSVPVTATPASGSQFPLGLSSVSLSATDAAGNTAHDQILVNVQDTTAPALTVPASTTAEATSASGASVSYPAAAATDAVGVASLTYSQNSGTQFALGATTVTVTAKDAANNTSNGSFTVTVKDTIAPALTVAGDVTAEATSANGANVAYAAATATDAVGVSSLTYSQNSGTQFPLGTTTVNVTAKDAANNTSSGAFTVTVKDTTAPALSVPANITAEATSASGAAVTYPAATATDAVTASPAIAYSAASGSTFALGSTTVNVSAKDGAGNTSGGSFTITVRDTTAPALTLPASQVLEATSAAGAVATFSASATDAVGVASLTYSAASGTTFPIGTSTVTVTTKDAVGNTNTGSFTITVRDTTAPAISSATPSNATLWPPNHQMVPISVAVVASDNTGYVAKIIGVTSSEPDNGLGDGDTAGDIQITGNLTLNLRAERGGKSSGRIYTLTIEARDAYGNASTRTCTVSVLKSQGGK